MSVTNVNRGNGVKKCHYRTLCVKKWKIPFADFVSLHRELSEAPPFGPRSLLERSPFVLRSSFVSPSFDPRYRSIET